jgi:hypothetical protein
MRKETTSQYMARIGREQKWAQEHREHDKQHQLEVEFDYNKSFNSRPGSDDWLAKCSCGWTSSKYYYGSDEAWAGAGRHLRKVMRGKEKER